MQIQRERFPIWRGDLLIGALGARGLFRVVLDGDRAVVTEPIPLQKRVRDMLELDDGRLLLWTDEAALLTIEPVSGSDAALTVRHGVPGCHRINDGFSHRMGPDLYHLLDRKVASAENYAAYTPALKKLGGEWNKQRSGRIPARPAGRCARHFDAVPRHRRRPAASRARRLPHRDEQSRRPIAIIRRLDSSTDPFKEHSMRLFHALCACDPGAFGLRVRSRRNARATHSASARCRERVRRDDGARDHKAFATFLAEDAVFFGATALRGKAAVVEGWKGFYEKPDAPFSWSSESVEVLDSGKLAHSSGPVLNAKGERVGTFNSIWRRESDGKLEGRVRQGLRRLQLRASQNAA